MESALCTVCNAEIGDMKLIRYCHKDKCDNCYREIRRQTHVRYYKKNRETLLEKSRDFSKTHREERNDIQKRYREVRKKDPISVIETKARKNIYKYIHLAKTNKHRDLIGTSPLYFKLWLYYTMKDDMSWENYGKLWQIDHVIPVRKFDLSNITDLHNAFHWSNCRAENVTFNIKKQSSVIPSQLEYHQKDVDCYKKILSFKKSLQSEIRNQAALKKVEGSTTR